MKRIEAAEFVQQMEDILNDREAEITSVAKTEWQIGLMVLTYALLDRLNGVITELEQLKAKVQDNERL